MCSACATRLFSEGHRGGTPWWTDGYQLAIAAFGPETTFGAIASGAVAQVLDGDGGTPAPPAIAKASSLLAQRLWAKEDSPTPTKGQPRGIS